MLLSLIHPLISNLIPSTPKVTAGIQPHLPRDPPTSTLSQHTLSSLSPSASPPPLLSQLSLPLPLDAHLTQFCHNSVLWILPLLTFLIFHLLPPVPCLIPQVVLLYRLPSQSLLPVDYSIMVTSAFPHVFSSPTAQPIGHPHGIPYFFFRQLVFLPRTHRYRPFDLIALNPVTLPLLPIPFFICSPSLPFHYHTFTVLYNLRHLTHFVLIIN